MKEQLNTLETQDNPAPVSSASIGALQVCMKVTVNAVMIFDSDPCTNLFRGPFLESLGNLTGPKSNIQIEI